MNSSTNKILLVEDDLDIQDNLKTFLEMENFEVSSAMNGKQAIDLMQQQGKPNLILLDLMMPIMNGYEMLAAMKNHELFRDKPVPVILLSAAIDIEATATEQVVKFIRKPISLDKLLMTIKEIQAQITA